MKKILCSLATFVVINNSYAVVNSGFSYKDAAINPACIAMFNSSVADLAYINTINIDYCQDSNAAFKRTLKGEDGSYYFYTNDKNSDEGFYSYKVVGKSANGIYILSTKANSGGTGVFTDLLLMKLTKTKIPVFDKNSVPQMDEITQLRLLGIVNGGDRCIGSFDKLKLEGNLLKIKQHVGSNPIDCQQFKEYSIDLGKLD